MSTLVLFGKVLNFGKICSIESYKILRSSVYKKHSVKKCETDSDLEHKHKSVSTKFMANPCEFKNDLPTLSWVHRALPNCNV